MEKKDAFMETAISKRRMIRIWSPTIVESMWYLNVIIPDSRLAKSQVTGLRKDWRGIIQSWCKGLGNG